MRVLLVVYDNQSYINEFPIGLAYIASVLIKNGYEVEIYSQDFYRYPDDHLTDYLNRNKFDVIGVGVVGGYYQYRKLLSISSAINKSKNRPFYIIGGHGPSPEPEFFLRKTLADAVVIGEGEDTIVELMSALVNKASLSRVSGIAYRDGEHVKVNKRRLVIQDIDSIPYPAYELFPIHYYRLMRMPHSDNLDFVIPVLSGRGCAFKCNFCYRMDEGFRARSSESVIEEIKLLRTNYNINYIPFYDELLMSSIKRTVEFCEALIRYKVNIKWSCNGRLNYAKPEVLKLMKEAGCVFINYGIEAMDDKVLRNMNKALTTEQIIKGVENTLNAEISPGLNIIFGNIGDSRETLNKGVDFLLKYDDFAQMRTIRPVTPYPGSPLYYHSIQKGLMKDCEDFYENKHINSDLLAVNFTELSDEEFYGALCEANLRLLKNYFDNKMNKTVAQIKKLYFERDKSFRGFRQT